MKKLINNLDNIVLEMCAGIVMSCPNLELIKKYKVIKKKEINKNKVTLISGGGSGHEPAHAGYVGKGMLDAAVCGDVFASPSQVQVYKAIQATATDKGTLLIIKNYSGDLMNFQNAAYLASLDGIKADFVKVNDDIAVEDSLYTVGRRGVAGTVLVHKIAGAAAESGLSLSEVKDIAQDAADNVRSLGFAFAPCTVPAKGTPTFHLEDSEMEFGVGIHGEPGIKKEKIAPSKELANRIVKALLKDLNKEGEQTKEVALLINGFGGTPLQELYILCYDAMAALDSHGVQAYKIIVGNYMTSIDMQGASISILKLNDSRKKWLDEPCDAPSFVISGKGAISNFLSVEAENDKADIIEYKTEKIKDSNKLTFKNLKDIIYTMGEIIIENEVPFCELDSHAGDGDFGMSVSKGFRKLQEEWNHIITTSTTMEEFLNDCSTVIMEHCGGASGPVWGFAFKYASSSVKGKQELTVSDVADLLAAAAKGIQDVGERSFGRGAVVGDKTLIDALVPMADCWKAQSGKSLKEASILGSAAACDGAKKTEQIVARMGRAGTVGERSLGHPDAGAHAIGVIFTKLLDMHE